MCLIRIVDQQLRNHPGKAMPLAVCSMFSFVFSRKTEIRFPLRKCSDCFHKVMIFQDVQPTKSIRFNVQLFKNFIDIRVPQTNLTQQGKSLIYLVTYAILFLMIYGTKGFKSPAETAFSHTSWGYFRGMFSQLYQTFMHCRQTRF